MSLLGRRRQWIHFTFRKSWREILSFVRFDPVKSTYSSGQQVMSGRKDTASSDDGKEELRRMAVEVSTVLQSDEQSLLKETNKRKQLAESIGSEAFYTVVFNTP